MDVINYSWDKMNNDIAYLSAEIQHSDFVPYEIVGVVRGGTIPGVVLSHTLNAPFSTLKWSTRDSGQREESLWLKYVKDAESGKKILLVDDIIDSGKTMCEMFDLAAKVWPHATHWRENIKVACLWYNPSQPFPANYAANVVDRDIDKRWVVFPWEMK